MLQHEVLGVIWFVILAVAWIVYLALESFIVGSGMLQTIVSKDDSVQKSILFPSGLHWDGIEVWLITALGGTFAAFPLVYAKTTESLYVAFFLLLLALIIRGVTIEFTYKDDNPKWQKFMKLGWQVSSFLIPLVLGVYFANIFLGLKLGADGYEGTFLGLFSVKALVMGIVFVAISLTTGAYWIIINTKQGEHHDKAHKIGLKTSIIVALGTIFIMMAFNTGAGIFNSSLLYVNYPVFWAVPVLTVLVTILTVLFAYKKKVWLAFISGCLTQALIIATGYSAIFPYMVPSSIDSKFGITLYDAASSQYTLQVMFIMALIFIPIVLGYQSWKFWYFSKDRRKKV
jgi:cytochrome d ubiquinol oxidase subunit II